MRRFSVLGTMGACALLVVAASRTAYADDPWFFNKDAGKQIGEGLTRLLLGGLLLAALEVGVWLFEALVYWRIAGLSGRRALLTSLFANMASIVAGLAAAPIALSLLPPGEPGMWVLFGMVVTLATEVPIVLAVNRPGPAVRGAAGTRITYACGHKTGDVARERLLLTAVGANVVSYLLFCSSASLGLGALTGQ